MLSREFGETGGGAGRPVEAEPAFPHDYNRPMSEHVRSALGAVADMAACVLRSPLVGFQEPVGKNGSMDFMSSHFKKDSQLAGRNE